MEESPVGAAQLSGLSPVHPSPGRYRTQMDNKKFIPAHTDNWPGR